MLHKIRWEAREKKSHSEIIRQTLDMVWREKKTEISRKTFEIRDGDVEHKKSTFRSLPKFKQFFCFRTDPTNKDIAYYRELSCCCDHCLTCDFDNCERVESCGAWKEWKLVQIKRRRKKARSLRSDSIMDIDDTDEKLYCFCKKPYDGNKWMVCCDGCEDWFHQSCVDMDDDMREEIEQSGGQWHCPTCQGEEDG